MRPITVDRETLYKEVWEEPTSSLAKRYSISNVGLAKVCRKLQDPVPPRGYWARIRNGHFSLTRRTSASVGSGADVCSFATFCSGTLILYRTRTCFRTGKRRSTQLLASGFFRPIPSAWDRNGKVSAYFAEHYVGNAVSRGDFRDALFPDL